MYRLNQERTAGSGDFFEGVSGEAIGDRKLVYQGADELWYLADADAAATMPVIGLTMHATALGGNGWILKAGFIGDVTTPWAWITGGAIYATGTPGELSQTAPALIRQTIGRATSTTQIFFSPQIAETGSAMGCSILEGATAYVGFDSCKEPFANYFLCDGTADNVETQEAVDYILGLGLSGKPKMVIEAGQYTYTAAVDLISNLTLEVYGEIIKGFAGSPFQIHGTIGTPLSDIDMIGGTYDGNKAAFPDNNPFISLQYANYLLFENMFFYDVSHAGDRGYGIRVTTANTVDWVRVLRCRGETSFGLVLLDYTDHFIIAENYCFDNDIDIRIVACKNGVVANNEIYNGNGGGITVMGGSTFVQVIGNAIAYKDKEGIEFAQADYCSAVGNHLYHNSMGGLKCWDFNYCLIEGNYCIDNACANASPDMPLSAQILVYTWVGPHESQYNVVEGNYVYSTGTVAPNVLYGIGEMESGGLGTVDHNTYKDNYISGHATSPGLFVGDNNVYNAKVFSFVDGNEAQDNGFVINAGGEFARVYGWLPLEAHKAIKIKVHARAEVLEADAMMAGFNIWVGAEGEQFNAHDCTDLALPSTSTNFAQNEIIRWTIESACVKLMTGGDSFIAKANHAVAAGLDCATEASFRTVSVEYI